MKPQHCFFLVLLFSVAVRPAAAQLLSPRDFLFASGGMRRDSVPLGMNPLTPGPALRLVTNDANRVVTGGMNAETVRSLTNGRHTGDFWGQERFLFASLGVAGTRAELFLRRGRQAGSLLTQERLTEADIHDTMAAVRVTARIGKRQELFVGAERDSTAIPFRSDSLTNLFPVFPNMPDGDWRLRRTQSTVGMRGDVGYVLLETSLVRQWADGDITLQDAHASLTLPTAASGQATALSAVVPLPHSSQLNLWTTHGSNSGERDALRDGNSNIGITRTMTEEHNTGLAWERHYVDGSTLSFRREWSTLRTRLDALGLLSAALGYTSSDFNVVSGYVDAHLSRRTLGVQWQHPLTKTSRLMLDGSYLETPVFADFGYSARLVLVAVQQEDSWHPRTRSGFGIRTRYSRDFVLPGMAETPLTGSIELSQYVPSVPLRRKRSSPSTATHTTRETRGGWSLGASLAYRFR